MSFETLDGTRRQLGAPGTVHAHCFVFNTTWDDEESRWKAGQFADLKRDAPYFEAVFHSRLARGLEELGLPTQRTKKGWELCDLPASTIQKFSRRTALIERAAEEQGVSDPEAKSELGANGKRVFTFAPSADASRGVLRKEGFADADTVARLLKDERMQEEIEGQVIWIDEAGLLGTRTMGEVFDLACRLDARVILSGDRRQHGSVERGAALRLLEEEAGIRPAEIREIQRQRGDYKQAVQALSEGRTDAGFRQLDRLGWIIEVNEADRYQMLAADYLEAVGAGKTALVVSPTHREGEWITDEIRARLKAAGKLGPEEHRFVILENANLTEAERRDAVNYSPGDVVVFHQNCKGFTKGQRLVAGEDLLPLDQAARFQVFHSNVLPVASGDIIRVTRNGMTADGKHRLNNGELFTVKKFNAQGDLVLANGWAISKEFGHLAHGYVVTSYASQGKTVDRVFIGQSSASLLASSREQFYVSASRGRERATVYTDDKAALLAAVSQSDERITATEFVAGRHPRDKAVTINQMARYAAELDKAVNTPLAREERSYER